MFQDDAVFALLMFGVGAYLFYMWATDLSNFKKNGADRKGAFEGARPASILICVLAAVFALLLLLSHTVIESSLGVTDKQTQVSWWALFSWVSAAFVEELVFRGYLVIKNKGTAALVAGIILFSLIFALAHPFMWNYEVAEGAKLWEGAWTFNFTLQPALSTLAVFECSLLFYFLRFNPMNPSRSLAPCVIAHLAYNLGVFAVKLGQGYVL